MRSVVVLFVIASQLWTTVVGYSDGAPESACTTMTPQHNADPSTMSPFQSIPEKDTIFSNGSLKIELKSPNGDKFKGYLIMGFDEKDNVIGTFSDSNTINCSDKPNSAATHSDGEDKDSVIVTWTPPSNFGGKVTFRTTFVSEKSKFWVKVDAVKTVTVTEVEDNTPPTISTTTAKSINAFDEIYEDCASKKGCFGFPEKCIKSRQCLMMVTYDYKEEETTFEIFGLARSGEYVAVGFSKEDKMGADSVIECVNNNGILSTFKSFNIPEYKNERQTEFTELEYIETKSREGLSYCKVKQKNKFTAKDEFEFDLTQPIYLLLARGRAGKDSIKQHEKKTISNVAIELSKNSVVGVDRGVMKKVHGSLMVIAWLMSSSIGMMFPRYMKKTWVGKQWMKKDRWFIIHQSLMSVTWFLTCAGFIVIFVDLGGWTSITSVSEEPHPLIGCITTALAFIQPFMAFWRPMPNSPNRYLFNFFHRLIGYSAHILAITCIFLAVDMESAQLPVETYAVLITHVSVYVAVHFILTLLLHRNENYTKFNTGKLVSRNSLDDMGSAARKGLIGSYILCTIILGVAVLVFIAQANM